MEQLKDEDRSFSYPATNMTCQHRSFQFQMQIAQKKSLLNFVRKKLANEIQSHKFEHESTIICNKN